MYQLKHILFIVFTTLLCLGLNAQVHIGDGVSINEGTQLYIHNQDVVIDTDEIRGKGDLVISNEAEHSITVNTQFETEGKIDVKSDATIIKGNYASKFTAMYLPKLSNEIRLAAAEEERKQSANKVDRKQDLPIRHINFQGLVFGDRKNDAPVEPVFKNTPAPMDAGIIIGNVYELNAYDLQQDYIIPIYSTLNDVRFSDDAELYKFEGLTAILKPPIV